MDPVPTHHEDDPNLTVALTHTAEYVVAAATIRNLMGDHTTPIDDVVRNYIAAVENDELSLPTGHAEFAALEFDVEIPAQPARDAA